MKKMTTELTSTKLYDEMNNKYSIVEKRLSELSSIEEEKYQTSGRFYYNPSNQYNMVDVTNCQSLETLINIHSFIVNKADDYDNSASLLKLYEYPAFKWCGFLKDSWIHDIELRVKILSVSDKKNKLLSAKQKLQEFIPQDIKLRQLLLELENIS